MSTLKELATRLLLGVDELLAEQQKERRSGWERRVKDKMPNPSMRQQTRRAAQRVRERIDVATRIVLDSVTPPNFAVGDPAHQIVAHLENAIGGTIPGTITFSTGNAAIVSVDANGAVTPVGEGTADIKLNYQAAGPAVPELLVSFSVTNPIQTVDFVGISPTTLSIPVGGFGIVAAVPRAGGAGGAAVLGQTVTWVKETGAGDVALSPDSGPESHQTTVEGLVAGVRSIRAECNSIPSVSSVITVTTPTGLVDSEGLLHEFIDSSWLPGIQRIMGSVESSPDPISTGVGCGAVRVGDWFKGWCEGADDAGENVFLITTDPTVPLQAIRASLYGPGAAMRCGEFRCSPGQPGNQAFGRIYPFEITQANRYNVGTGPNPTQSVLQAFNTKPRRMVTRSIIKIVSGMPALEFTKWDTFLNPRNVGGGASMMQVPSGSPAGTVQTVFGPTRLNPQATPDNNLTDNAVLTNAIWSGGASFTHNSPVGVGLVMNWEVDKWYDCVRRARINTYNGPYTGADGKRGPGQTGDGWHEYWRRESVDGQSWGPWQLYGNNTGILNQVANINTQQWWSKSEAYYMMHYNNITALTGRIRIAYFGNWFGEFE